MQRSRFSTLLLAGLAGATTMFLFDPNGGARRRALLRDQVRHLSAQTPRRISSTLRALGGQCRGTVHNLSRFFPCGAAAPPADDVELKHRVETELGRDPWIPLGKLNFDALDGVVRVRGTVWDVEIANRIVSATAAVEGVGAVLSLMRTFEGTPVGGTAGNIELLDAGPRGELHAEEVRDELFRRWPSLTDRDILESEGHLGKLSETIHTKTGMPAQAIRVELEEILLAAV